MNNLKLGKLPATYDQRTLQLQTILKMRELPPIPKIFDCDTALPAPIPLLLFGNNKWGDCVIAARANQTLRLVQKDCATCLASVQRKGQLSP